jgi:hypothetical protein
VFAFSERRREIDIAINDLSAENRRPDPIEGEGLTCGLLHSMSDLIAAGLAGPSSGLRD